MIEAKITDLEGLTIEFVDDSCVNCVVIGTTDGQTFKIFSECGNGDFSIPYFEVYRLEKVDD